MLPLERLVDICSYTEVIIYHKEHTQHKHSVWAECRVSNVRYASNTEL